MGYAQDSFFTLGMGGRIGLVALSLVLMGLCLAFVWACSNGLGRVWRVLIALAVFWGFVWLSPQIYYGYYLLIFDDLPLQWVVKEPPTPWDVGQLISFTGRATLSHHGQGIFAWLLVGVALLRRRSKRL